MAGAGSEHSTLECHMFQFMYLLWSNVRGNGKFSVALSFPSAAQQLQTRKYANECHYLVLRYLIDILMWAHSCVPFPYAHGGCQCRLTGSLRIVFNPIPSLVKGASRLNPIQTALLISMNDRLLCANNAY